MAFTLVNTMAVEVDPEHRAIATSIYGFMRFMGYALGPVLTYPFYLVSLLSGVALLAIATTMIGLFLILRVSIT